MRPSIGIVGRPEGAGHANASPREIGSICCAAVWLREIGGAVYEITCDVETKVGSILCWWMTLPEAEIHQVNSLE
jgi:hypothetical protein